jgi:hypothetical protein
VEGKPNGKYMKYYERNLEWCLLNVLPPSPHAKMECSWQVTQIGGSPGWESAMVSAKCCTLSQNGLVRLAASGKSKEVARDFPISKFLKCIWWLDRSPWFPGDPRVHRSLGSKHKSKIQGHFGMEQHG